MINITVKQALCFRINELLVQKNMTQPQLEKNSGISHRQLNTILQGKNKYTKLRTIKKLADGFGVSVVEFFACHYFEADKLDLE